MKILITGINGQVGSTLVRQAKAQSHEVIAISRAQWDMGLSPEYGVELVVKLKPDLVINSAAYTNVDRAEEDENTSLKVNADAPRALAKACQQLKIPIFHVSTDYVFDGTKEDPYIETDQTNPINAYGRTKLAGEIAIQEEAEKYIILRTSWVFSKNGKNFVNTILKLAKERDDLMVVNDQFGGPTSAESIAKVLLHLANAHKEQWGIYHYSGLPFVSWFEYTRIIFKQALINDGNFKVPVLTACTSAELNNKTARPKNSRLNSDLIERLFSIKQNNWREYL